MAVLLNSKPYENWCPKMILIFYGVIAYQDFGEEKSWNPSEFAYY